MKTCPTCSKVFADNFEICPHCEEAVRAEIARKGENAKVGVIAIATWVPFSLFALLSFALLHGGEPRYDGWVLGALALWIFPPVFRILPILLWGRVLVALSLFALAIIVAPRTPAKFAGTPVTTGVAPASVQAQSPENAVDQAERSLKELHEEVARQDTAQGSSSAAAAAPTQTTPPPARDAATDRTTRMIKSDGAVGCLEKDKFEQLARLAAEGDREAWKRTLMADMLSDQCIPMKAGDVVYIEDTAIFSGLVKVRRKGEVDAYWTNTEELN